MPRKPTPSSAIPETVMPDGHINAQVYRSPRAITAAASRVDLSKKKEKDRLDRIIRDSKWQKDAWDMYDLVGEIKFSANLIGNVISRISLNVSYVEDDSRVPTPLHQLPDNHEAKEYTELAYKILGVLKSSDGGTSGFLRDSAINYYVPGECYLVQEMSDPFNGIPERWQIRSTDEIVATTKGKTTKVQIKSSRSDRPEDYIDIHKDAYFARLWQRHPRFSAEADSSVRGVLDECDDLLLLSREMRATSKSRVSAGLLLIPDSLDQSAQGDASYEEDPETGETEAHYTSTIEEDITRGLTDPIHDEDHVNAASPVIIRGPSEALSVIKHISLSRPNDQLIQKEIESKIERILTALDIPKDIARGLADVKYSNSLAIEESLYKAHIEPLILLIVDNLTSALLRSTLIESGVPEEVAMRMVIWYDPSAITAKPSKAEAANFGIENKLLSGKAWRELNGFTDEDAPSEEEIAMNLVFDKLILNEQTSDYLLQTILPNLMEALRNKSLEVSDPSSANALEQALNPEEQAAQEAVNEASGGFIQEEEEENNALPQAPQAPSSPLLEP